MPGTRIGIMLVGCTALAVACGQTGDTSQCEELITRLKKDPAAAVVYEPMIERQTSGYATLNWNGMAVPVPVKGVTDVIVSKSELEGFDVVVAYYDKSIITVLGASAEADMAAASIGHYEISAAEARCDRPSLLEQLILKTMARPFRVRRAHRVGDALLLQGDIDDSSHNVWEWTRLSGDMVTYRGSLKDWGYAISNPGGELAWLSELNAFLAEGTGMTRLRSAFERAGLSQKSLDALDALRQRPTFP